MAEDRFCEGMAQRAFVDPGLVIAVDEPGAEDVSALLEGHLRFSRQVTPLEFAFALDVDQLLGPGVTLFSARQGGVLVGVGALKRLDESHAELKSMHVREVARCQGVGRAIVDHLLDVARRRCFTRVSLETGATEEFVPARALYTKAGFRPCEPFGDYSPSPYNTYMTISLDPMPAE